MRLILFGGSIRDLLFEQVLNTNRFRDYHSQTLLRKRPVMNERKLVQRGLMRRALRKEMRRAEPDDSRLIQFALDDRTVFETCYCTSMQQAQLFGEGTGAFQIVQAKDGARIVDNLLELFQWFITNGPTLIAIIRQIIELFGSVSAAIEICESETIFVD